MEVESSSAIEESDYQVQGDEKIEQALEEDQEKLFDEVKHDTDSNKIFRAIFLLFF